MAGKSVECAVGKKATPSKKRKVGQEEEDGTVAAAAAAAFERVTRRRSGRVPTKPREEKERLVKERVELLLGQPEPEPKPEPEPEREPPTQVANGTCSGRRRSRVKMGNSQPLVAKSAHAMVKDTLRLFNKHYLHFVQEEEMRCQKVQVLHKASKASKTKKGKPLDLDVKKKAKRPDLKAISKMLDNNEIMCPVKRIGNLPGVDVGHRFYSRAEMVAVGLHSHWLNGIDYMGMSCKKGEYSDYTFPLAVAIVISGMYEDDLDNAEDVIYTGQGGHNLTGNKRQVRDQELKRGNLALKNNVDQSVPVRVVRGHESNSSYTGRVYTYDGLYKVVKYWAEKGLSGYTVFKYRLQRLEGQPTLTTNQVQSCFASISLVYFHVVKGTEIEAELFNLMVGGGFSCTNLVVLAKDVHFAFGRVPQSVSEIRGLVCEDISGGQEDVPIPATNLVDDPPVAPTGFTYLKSLKVAKSVKLPAYASGCSCKGSCVDPRTCACARLNGSDFPYVHLDGGRLIEPKDVVFECGPNCGCGPSCVNRTSQRGLKYRFEVFRTARKGWAVRSWDFIPSGAPLCEYVGVLTRTEDMESVSDNSYIFDIDCLQTMKGIDGRVRRSQGAAAPPIDNLDVSDGQKCESFPDFCIDACSSGNIARFINHSCEPNLFVQCVLSSHHDMKLARVMLFAADNIPPLQELTYDYGYALDSVQAPDGKIIQMPCYCGADGCRRRLY